MTKQIELTHGRFALVDDEDYDELNQYKWQAQKGCRTFYAHRTCNNRKRTTVQMHREILGLTPGDGKITDHRNRNGLDNRRANLRIVSQMENLRNHGGHSGNTSGFNGVSWFTGRNKWAAQICVDYENKHLGLYDKIEDAVEARRLGELKYWGEVSI